MKRKKLTDDQKAAAQMLAQEIPPDQIAEDLDISVRTLYRWKTLPNFRDRVKSFVKARLQAEAKIADKEGEKTAAEEIGKAANRLANYRRSGSNLIAKSIVVLDAMLGNKADMDRIKAGGAPSPTQVKAAMAILKERSLFAFSLGNAPPGALPAVAVEEQATRTDEQKLLDQLFEGRLPQLVPDTDLPDSEDPLESESE